MTAMLQKNDDNGGTGSVAMPDVVLGVTWQIQLYTNKCIR